MPLFCKWIFVGISVFLLVDAVRGYFAVDCIVMESDSLSFTYYSLFRLQTDHYRPDDIRFLGFYPAFHSLRTSFGIAITAKSKMIPLLHIQGQDAIDAFDALRQIPWIAPKILRVDAEFLFQEKDRRPLSGVRNIWPNFKALMIRPVRFPRL